MQDITIMCEKADFKRIHSKPNYEGHFMEDMFLWALNKQYNEKHAQLIVKAWQAYFAAEILKTQTEAAQPENAPLLATEKKDEALNNSAQLETEEVKKSEEKPQEVQQNRNGDEDVWDEWDDIEEVQAPLKYKVQQPFISWRKEDIAYKIQEHKTWDLSQHPPWQINFQFQCEDFWLKKQPARREQLLKKMCPNLYNMEMQPHYEKIQHHWVFQQMEKKDKMKWLQSRKPQYSRPGINEYHAYMEKIKNFAKINPKTDILSIQTFACHGMVVQGAQQVVANRFDEQSFFYQLINAEFTIRQESIKLPNVFFLCLFACCRESYHEGKKKGEQAEGKKARGGEVDELGEGQVANFTFFFGCNPAAGVAADTKFVRQFIDHVTYSFAPETGTCIIPDCINTVDTSQSKVSFESTSSNLGRSLQLVNLQNRVGSKILIVITESPHRQPTQKTMALLEFFMKKLRFNHNELLIINEKEAKDLESLLNSSFIYKVHNLLLEEGLYYVNEAGKKDPITVSRECDLQPNLGLRQFANQIFRNTQANARPLLCIYLNEAEDEDVRDFITNRNPDFALNIEPWYDYDKFGLPSAPLRQYRSIPKAGPSDDKRKKFLREYNQDQKSLATDDQKEKWIDFYEDSLPDDQKAKYYDLPKYIDERESFLENYNKVKNKIFNERWINYFPPLYEAVRNVNQIRFENNHRFFPHEEDNFTFCSWDKRFKTGTGQFDYILDIKEKVNKTIKANFEFLEKHPVRFDAVSKHSIGCSLYREKQETSLVVTLKEDDKYLTPEEEQLLKPGDDSKKYLELYYVKDAKKVEGSLVRVHFRISAALRVLKLKKLYVDEKKLEVYFALIFKKSEGLILGKVGFANEVKPDCEFRQIRQLVDTPIQDEEKKAWYYKKRNEKKCQKTLDEIKEEYKKKYDSGDLKNFDEVKNKLDELEKKLDDQEEKQKAEKPQEILEAEKIIENDEAVKLNESVEKNFKQIEDLKTKICDLKKVLKQQALFDLFEKRDTHHRQKKDKMIFAEIEYSRIQKEQEEEEQLDKLKKDSSKKKEYEKKVRENKEYAEWLEEHMKLADIEVLVEDLRKKPEEVGTMSKLQNDRWQSEFDILRCDTLEMYLKEVSERYTKLEEKKEKNKTLSVEEESQLQNLKKQKDRLCMDTQYPILQFSGDKSVGKDITYVKAEEENGFKGGIDHKNFQEYMNSDPLGPYLATNVQQKIQVQENLDTKGHLRVFASRAVEGEGNCLFYIFTNKIGESNKPTPLEIQVFEWTQDGEPHSKLHDVKRGLQAFSQLPQEEKSLQEEEKELQEEEKKLQEEEQKLSEEKRTLSEEETKLFQEKKTDLKEKQRILEVNKKKKKTQSSQLSTTEAQKEKGAVKSLKEVLKRMLLQRHVLFTDMIRESQHFRMQQIGDIMRRIVRHLHYKIRKEEEPENKYKIERLQSELEEQDKKDQDKQQWVDVEIFQKYPKSIKQSSDNKNRLIFSDQKCSYLYDFQMVNTKMDERNFEDVYEKAWVKGENGELKQIDKVDKKGKKVQRKDKDDKYVRRQIKLTGNKTNEPCFLKVYSFEEIKEGKAFGLQKRPFIKQLDMIAPKFVSLLASGTEAKYQTSSVIIRQLDSAHVVSQANQKLPKVVPLPSDIIKIFYKKILEAQQKEQKEIEEEEKKQKQPNYKSNPDSKNVQAKQEDTQIDKQTQQTDQAGDDQKAKEDIKVEMPQFYFAFDKQSISLVSQESRKEFTLVNQRSKCMYDRLCDPWVTYDAEKKHITIHYFESFSDYRDQIKSSKYTTFVLTEDFLSTIVSCGELIPSTKTKLVSHLSQLQNGIKLLKLMKKKFEEFNKERNAELHTLRTQINKDKPKEPKKEKIEPAKAEEAKKIDKNKLQATEDKKEEIEPAKAEEAKKIDIKQLEAIEDKKENIEPIKVEEAKIIDIDQMKRQTEEIINKQLNDFENLMKKYGLKLTEEEKKRIEDLKQVPKGKKSDDASQTAIQIQQDPK